MGPELETARLRLRPFTRADVDALHAHWTEPEVLRYLWDGVVIARAQAAAIVEESIASFAARRFGMWVVMAQDGGRLVGFSGLRPIPERTDVELYYGLSRPYWGRGFATEAARAVLRHGFEEAELDPIYVRTDGPNVESVAVMKRLGARYPRTDRVGAFGSTVTYVIRRDEFVPGVPASA
jgi:RimJ/RimL family protein N-acetyltransferase